MRQLREVTGTHETNTFFHVNLRGAQISDDLRWNIELDRLASDDVGFHQAAQYDYAFGS